MRQFLMNALRGAGFLLILSAAFLWWRNGLISELPTKIGVLPIPLPLLPLFFGIMLVAFPRQLLILIVDFLPDGRGDRLRRVVAELEYKDPTPVTTDSVASLLHQYRKSTDRRYYGTVIAVAAAFFFVLPVIVVAVINGKDQSRDRRDLVQVVQTQHPDYAAADQFSRVLERIHEPITAPSEAHSAESSRLLYSLLSALYGDHRSSSLEEFAERARKAYERHVLSHVQKDSGLLSSSYVSKLSSHDKEASAAYLTVLGALCNEQGEQGAHLSPYLQSRQLLTQAQSMLEATRALNPSTHNQLGVANASLAKPQCYERYVRHFEQFPEAMKAALGEAQPLRVVTLIQSADAHYDRAVQDSKKLAGRIQSADAFAEARFRNNKVDLTISLLTWLYIEDRELPVESNGESNFLLERAAWPIREWSAADAERLSTIFRTSLADVDFAIKLSRQPQIPFTKAQVLSLLGSMIDEHGAIESHMPLTKAAAVNEALRCLSTAKDLQLPGKLFSEEMAQVTGLAWLWQQDGCREALKRLSEDGQVARD